MKVLRIVGQVLLIHAFFLMGEGFVHLSGLPVPGNLAGLGFLFTALCLGWIKVSWVEEGARWLLAELLLFFIPSAVGIMQYPQVMSIHGWPVWLTIAIGTVLAMACTGLMADRLNRGSREVTES
ncbi:CidA/LrgA family protein [Polycladomyces sp. WAk]|uniref:CidA/LrgA family protein n=1 Tax=Polycladomyces zharkentensis TaxID=2807616 RepID=A0ABS2WFM8_9BACL|nr:CidA/LrgA family protein [Polycladomyces sp. WAk]